MNFLLELLKMEESAALAWDHKLFKIRSTIVTTAKVADFSKLQFPLPENYLIRRKRKLQTAISIIMAGIFTLLFGYILVTKFSTGAVFVFTISLSLLYFVLYKNLTVKDLNYELQLSKEGIEIADKFYEWTEIEETFLVYRPDHKVRTLYLIIGLKNGILDRYHLNNLLEFNLTEKTLSALIEEYRHL